MLWVNLILSFTSSLSSLSFYFIFFFLNNCNSYFSAVVKDVFLIIIFFCLLVMTVEDGLIFTQKTSSCTTIQELHYICLGVYRVGFHKDLLFAQSMKERRNLCDRVWCVCDYETESEWKRKQKEVEKIILKICELKIFLKKYPRLAEHNFISSISYSPSSGLPFFKTSALHILSFKSAYKMVG